MRLLVSVRSASEVAPALEGGADIVDAKEPARGSLGPVDPAVLKEIAGWLPRGVPLSVALGDLRDPAAVDAAIHLLPSPLARRADYLKLGFAGLPHVAAAREVLAAAVARASVVAVAYADHRLAGSPSPHEVLELAAHSGATGVLLDTYAKDGRNLFAWIAAAALRDWVARARWRGLLTAVAGSLRVSHLPLLSKVGPDIVGIRGAACEGGRSGRLTAARVRAVRAALDGGETPDSPASAAIPATSPSLYGTP